ncbi:hypothetical protein IW261DRAFT_1567747 [Armillaria novae-zelandiae]|uniref:Uncharacterized protein n=1 Tax=Armillaria novae-zelandiae TaxID=153914 RepID=A0AA39P1P9_9AGAR|nr:hypothetical protein IW261DRAFT_1567747 [Armillaria novae-zelandiae]
MNTLLGTSPPQTPPLDQITTHTYVSDSDSDNYIMSTPYLSVAQNGEAQVTASTSSKNGPRISAGEVAHGTLHCFPTAAQKWRVTYHPMVTEKAIMPYLAPGFSDNAKLNGFYYQNSDHYNEYTPTEFRAAAHQCFFMATWHLDVCCTLDCLSQGDGSFVDFYNAVLTQNHYLEGNPEHVEDALLISTLKKGMHIDLSECCSDPDTELSKIFTAISNGTADATKEQTITQWVKLVEIEDEKLYHECVWNQRDTHNAINDLGLKHLHTNTFQSNATFTAPPQSLPASILLYHGNNTYNHQGNNVGTVRPANQYAALSPSNQFSSRSYIQNSHLTPCYNKNERWIMFFLTHFCINCRLPFQNHRKRDNVCEPCPAANYEICDVNFINQWVQAHPNGFENHRIPDPNIPTHAPKIIDTVDMVNAVECVQHNNPGTVIPPFFLSLAQNYAVSPTSSSNSIPIGQPSHIAPIQSIPHNYVAPILHSHAFPTPDPSYDCPSSRTEQLDCSRTYS